MPLVAASPAAVGPQQPAAYRLGAHLLQHRLPRRIADVSHVYPLSDRGDLPRQQPGTSAHCSASTATRPAPGGTRRPCPAPAPRPGGPAAPPHGRDGGPAHVDERYAPAGTARPAPAAPPHGRIGAGELAGALVDLLGLPPRQRLGRAPDLPASHATRPAVRCTSSSSASCGRSPEAARTSRPPGERPPPAAGVRRPGGLAVPGRRAPRRPPRRAPGTPGTRASCGRCTAAGSTAMDRAGDGTDESAGIGESSRGGGNPGASGAAVRVAARRAGIRAPDVQVPGRPEPTGAVPGTRPAAPSLGGDGARRAVQASGRSRQRSRSYRSPARSRAAYAPGLASWSSRSCRTSATLHAVRSRSGQQWQPAVRSRARSPIGSSRLACARSHAPKDPCLWPSSWRRAVRMASARL